MAAHTIRPIRKVLIANRGEIAVRILRGLHELGIRGAVVYSDADRAGLPVLLADEAYRIGPAASSESYLKGDDIVALAESIGADAIHPGYGFLSENAAFARRCEERGIRFIGPNSDAISAMGSKIESRRLMIDAGVPVVPGGRDPLPDVASAEKAAAEIGYPVMVKASAGGGGKGMRRVEKPEQLAAAFRDARSEAAAAFGDDAIMRIDQKRVVTPRQARDDGGSVLVIGRPISRADDPIAAARAIEATL